MSQKIKQKSKTQKKSPKSKSDVSVNEENNLFKPILRDFDA